MNKYELVVEGQSKDTLKICFTVLFYFFAEVVLKMTLDTVVVTHPSFIAYKAYYNDKNVQTNLCMIFIN